MITDIYKILEKYNRFDVKVNYLESLDTVIKDIENQLIHNKSVPLIECRDIMVELWQHQRTIERHNFINTETVQSFLRNLLTDTNYSFDGKYIRCSKSFVCNIIKDDTNVYMLNDSQSQRMKDLGYEITGYSFELGLLVYDLKCTGRHPNLSGDGYFCIDNYLHELPFGYDTINYINDMICQANISSSFLNDEDRNRIIEIIKK